jgi:hypothetical protein
LKRVPRSFHNHPEGSSLIVVSILIWWVLSWLGVSFDLEG